MKLRCAQNPSFPEPGAAGFRRPGAENYAHSRHAPISAPATRVEVADTIGAGDTFNAGVLAAAGSAARREDQAALAKAGEDKARIMADLRAIAGSAWTRADQKNRQLWFALGGVAAGILAWAIVPGLVAREIAPASWQWPERMAARTLDLPRWEAGQRMIQSASPTAFRAIVGADRIVTANRAAIEGCGKAAARNA